MLPQFPKSRRALDELWLELASRRRIAEWLLKVAIARGVNHYRRDFDPTLPANFQSA
jgi:hypothetical protein